MIPYDCRIIRPRSIRCFHLYLCVFIFYPIITLYEIFFLFNPVVMFGMISVMIGNYSGLFPIPRKRKGVNKWVVYVNFCSFTPFLFSLLCCIEGVPMQLSVRIRTKTVQLQFKYPIDWMNWKEKQMRTFAPKKNLRYAYKVLWK